MKQSSRKRLKRREKERKTDKEWEKIQASKKGEKYRNQSKIEKNAMRRKERTKKEGKGGRKNSKKEWKTISMRMREMEKVEIYMANECVCASACVSRPTEKEWKKN